MLPFLMVSFQSGQYREGFLFIGLQVEKRASFLGCEEAFRTAGGRQDKSGYLKVVVLHDPAGSAGEVFVEKSVRKP